MITKETDQNAAREHLPSEKIEEALADTQTGQVSETTNGSQEVKIVMEIVDMRIEFVQKRKHERLMERTLRWPIHSNTPRITF